MSMLRVRAVIAERRLDISFDVPAGSVLALVGPNGAGKSTALHVVSGLIRPDRGQVLSGERLLTDTDAGVHVPVHDRRVGLLLQDPLLFPHLDVRANVAFARAAGGRQGALRWLREVGAEELADRRPRTLSGGQAQRVAIARALAAEPEVLLLDEPMAGLDVTVAANIRAVLRRLLSRDGRSAVLVTHDVLDVVTLADQVVVLEGGRVAESGRTAEVLAAPRSAFGAQIAGVNLVSGVIAEPGVLQTPSGQHWHGVFAEPLGPGRSVVAVFPPSAVAVFTAPPTGSPRNVVAAVVGEFDARGTAIRVRAEAGPHGGPGIAADITAEAAAELRIAPGDQVWFAVKAQEVALHPV